MSSNLSPRASRWDWSDFVFTIAEDLFPRIGLCRLARFVVRRHYVDPNSRPGMKSLALGRISEREGNQEAAEGYYRAAVSVSSEDPDPFIYLGEFYEKRQRVTSAIDAYAEALKRAGQEPALTSRLQQRLQALRGRT
jgi:tetratricopeptide (TPR) repeat protein